MGRLNARTIVRVYLVIMLLLSILLSPLLQLGVALTLLVIQLFSAYKPQKAFINLVIVVVTVFFTPLVLQSLVGQTFAVLLIFPALLLLDSSLKEYALTQTFYFSKTGRSATNVLKSLELCFIIALLSGIIVSNLTLMLTATVLLIYISAALLYTYRNVPLDALKESKTWSRTIVGDTDSKLISIKANTRIPAKVFFHPVDSWVKINTK